jgi:hypothetical protein
MLAPVLSQQGTFGTFAGVYCCAIPLGMMIALLVVYFAIRTVSKNRQK